MKVIAISPVYREHFQFLVDKAAQPSLWQSEAAEAAAFADQDFADSDQVLQALHVMQSLRSIFIAGVENNADFRQRFDQAQLPTWKNFTSPPVDEALMQGLADKIYNCDSGKGDVAVLLVDNGVRRIGAMLLDKCLHNKIPTLVEINDAPFKAMLYEFADAKGISALGDDFISQTNSVTTRMSVMAGKSSEDGVKIDVDKLNLFAKHTAPFYERISAGKVFFTLTRIPTQSDAKIDDMDYHDYLRLFFEMCDQPWKHIGKAQQLLINKLNAGKVLRFTNADGTDLNMSIDGFTFCNSLIARNVPGSEVFSAPARDSVNGRIVSLGRFVAPRGTSEVIENLTLEFKDGQLVYWHADKGQSSFEKAIAVDDGAKFIGEIGIGTNPHLHDHLVNGLLVEKVGGSFHVALGQAYTNTDYLGIPVQINNGNKSVLHWDITTMLIGHGGRIYLDGDVIMEDGLYVDPKLDVLNRGWASIPRAERPAYWQDYYDHNPEIAVSRKRTSHSTLPTPAL